MIADRKNKYLFTLRFPFEAIDNLDARLAVRVLLKKMGLEESGEEEKKLQRIFKDKAPEKVDL